MKTIGCGAVGAIAAGSLMWAFIAYVNRPLVERFTIIMDGKEMQFQGALGFGTKRDTHQDTVEVPYFDRNGNWISAVPLAS